MATGNTYGPAPRSLAGWNPLDQQYYDKWGSDSFGRELSFNFGPQSIRSPRQRQRLEDRQDAWRHFEKPSHTFSSNKWGNLYKAPPSPRAGAGSAYFRSAEDLNQGIEGAINANELYAPSMFGKAGHAQPAARDYFQGVINKKGIDAANQEFGQMRNFQNLARWFSPSNMGESHLTSIYTNIRENPEAYSKVRRTPFASAKAQQQFLVQDAASPWIFTKDGKMHPNPFRASYGDFGINLDDTIKNKWWNQMQKLERDVNSSSRYANAISQGRAISPDATIGRQFYDYEAINPYLKDNLGYTLNPDAQYDFNAYIQPDSLLYTQGEVLPEYFRPATVTLSLADTSTGKSAGEAVFNQYAGIDNSVYGQQYGISNLDEIFARGTGAGMAETEKYGLEFNPNLSSFDPIAKTMDEVENPEGS